MTNPEGRHDCRASSDRIVRICRSSTRLKSISLFLGNHSDCDEAPYRRVFENFQVPEKVQHP